MKFVVLNSLIPLFIEYCVIGTLLVLFFSTKVKEEKCKISLEFLNFLINYDYLKLLCFVSDLGCVFSRYQKLLQSDNVLIFDIQNQTEASKIRMIELKNNAIPGGWENILK